jgi:hypothetical protein
LQNKEDQGTPFPYPEQSATVILPISQLRLPCLPQQIGVNHLPVQCQETRPSCENCTIKELECKYPTKADQHVQRRTNDASCAIAVAAPSVPQPLVAASDALQFSLTDLKFFHHFLVVAHPHLPLGNEEVWVQKIPLFAQEVRAFGSNVIDSSNRTGRMINQLADS